MAEISQESQDSFTQANEADFSAVRPIYEVAFHLVSTVGDEGVGAAAEKVRKLLGDAEIISEGFPQKLTFAYTIERASQGKREKYSEGYFGWIKFATEADKIPGLQKALTDLHEVLRFLIVETVREDIALEPRRVVFGSDRLEGKTLEKPAAAPEKVAEVSQEELDKSIDALVS